MAQNRQNRIEVDLPEELVQALERVAEALGLTTLDEAAIIAIADWTSRRTAELDNLDPGRRYIVNEALDELIDKKDR
jgi:metal-responsive CopG/Arc/MetJ family transcriptional regulator